MKRACVLVVLLMVGCGSIERPEMDATLASLSATLPSSVVYPRGGRTKELAELDPRSGERVGTLEREVFAADADGRFETVLVVTEPEPSDGPVLITRLVRATDGSVALREVESAKDEQRGGPRRVFFYDPPLVLMPATLSAGETYSSEAEISERDPDDTARVRSRGRVTRQIRAMTAAELAERFPVRSGDLPGAIGTIERLTVELAPAKVDRTTWSLLDPAVGIVEEIRQEQLRVFGIGPAPDETRRALVSQIENQVEN
ncbi:MAG: hypothetical protein AAFR38_02225 [Planctomycetota bacterium]